MSLPDYSTAEISTNQPHTSQPIGQRSDSVMFLDTNYLANNTITRKIAGLHDTGAHIIATAPYNAAVNPGSRTEEQKSARLAVRAAKARARARRNREERKAKKEGSDRTTRSQSLAAAAAAAAETSNKKAKSERNITPVVEKPDPVAEPGYVDPTNDVEVEQALRERLDTSKPPQFDRRGEEWDKYKCQLLLQFWFMLVVRFGQTEEAAFLTLERTGTNRRKLENVVNHWLTTGNQKQLDQYRNSCLARLTMNR